MVAYENITLLVIPILYIFKTNLVTHFGLVIPMKVTTIVVFPKVMNN